MLFRQGFLFLLASSFQGPSAHRVLCGRGPLRRTAGKGVNLFSLRALNKKRSNFGLCTDIRIFPGIFYFRSISPKELSSSSLIMDLFSILIVTLVILATYFYLFVQKTPSKMGMPGFPQVPLLGSFPFILYQRQFLKRDSLSIIRLFVSVKNWLCNFSVGFLRQSLLDLDCWF